MRELAVAALIALAFGIGSIYATGELGLYGALNLGFGALALCVAALGGARRLRAFGASAARGVLVRRVAGVALALALAAGMERCAAWTGLRLDWTLDRHFTLAPATREALSALDQPLHATLYVESVDARSRRTRLLLESFAAAGPLELRERGIGQAPAEEDRYGVGSGDSVVLVLGDRFELVERPGEGALLEAILRLSQPTDHTLYVAMGEGEGDFGSTEAVGFSGLRAALENEGYRLRGLVTAALDAVPEDASAVLIARPRRALRPEALEMLAGWLERGGRLVALLDPGLPTGLEALAERFGFDLPDGVVVDLASGPIEGAAAGVNPLVSAYAEHAVTRGLDARTMTFFVRARPVLPVRKPEPADRLGGLAFTSARAWLAHDVAAVERGGTPRRPADVPLSRFPLAAAGSYPRDAGEARIVLFGDSDFASNHYLRALYNLDLVMNAVHWVTERETAITLRPKRLTPNQDPLTPDRALGMFYGVGLAVPELLLIAGAIAWVRRRTG